MIEFVLEAIVAWCCGSKGLRRHSTVGGRACCAGNWVNGQFHGLGDERGGHGEVGGGPQEGASEVSQ